MPCVSNARCLRWYAGSSDSLVSDRDIYLCLKLESSSHAQIDPLGDNAHLEKCCVVGCFLFGLVLTMVFTDVTKLFTGRLRPRFLEICKHNATVCVGDELYTEEEVCTETDDDKLRDAR